MRAVTRRLSRDQLTLVQAGGLSINMVTHEVCAGGQPVEVTARTGPAIEAEARSHLFERFYRGDLARGREQGVGLGLSLAREFARAHGGDVLLESSADGWNTFCLVLPLDGESGQTRPESRT